MPYNVRRVAALFGETEFKELEAYVKKHKADVPSIYALVKKAVREYVQKHP